MHVPDEDYSRNVSCALISISTLLWQYMEAMQSFYIISISTLLLQYMKAMQSFYIILISTLLLQYMEAMQSFYITSLGDFHYARSSEPYAFSALKIQDDVVIVAGLFQFVVFISSFTIGNLIIS